MNAPTPAHTFRRPFQRHLPLIVAASALVLSACSSSSPNSGAPAVSAKADSKKAARNGKSPEATPATTAPTNSVFSVADTSKDPFFPKAKKAVAQAEAAAAAAPSPLDVYAQLQSGFQGVISSGDQRIALINNVMLEAGRQSEISIGAGNNSRVVTVRCREISRDSVVLDVQGYAQPLKIAYLSK